MNRFSEASRKRLVSLSASIVGIVLICAALSKIADLSAFHEIVLKYRFMPSLVKEFATILVPGLELVLGVCLVFNCDRRESAIVSVVLLLFFTLLGVYYTIVGGLDDCGCIKIAVSYFRGLSGWWLVARDMILSILSAIVIMGEQSVRNRAGEQCGSRDDG